MKITLKFKGTKLVTGNPNVAYAALKLGLNKARVETGDGRYTYNLVEDKKVSADYYFERLRITGSTNMNLATDSYQIACSALQEMIANDENSDKQKTASVTKVYYIPNAAQKLDELETKTKKESRKKPVAKTKQKSRKKAKPSVKNGRKFSSRTVNQSRKRGIKEGSQKKSMSYNRWTSDEENMILSNPSMSAMNLYKRLRDRHTYAAVVNKRLKMKKAGLLKSSSINTKK